MTTVSVDQSLSLTVGDTSDNAVAIGAGIGGGAVALLLLSIPCFFLWRSRNKKNAPPPAVRNAESEMQVAPNQRQSKATSEYGAFPSTMPTITEYDDVKDVRATTEVNV